MGERESKMGESEKQNRQIYRAYKKSKIGREKKQILSRPSLDGVAATLNHSPRSTVTVKRDAVGTAIC